MKNTHRDRRRLIHGCRSRSPSRCSAEKGLPSKAGTAAACLCQPWTGLRHCGCQTWCWTWGGGRDLREEPGGGAACRELSKALPRLRTWTLGLLLCAGCQHHGEGPGRAV